jgi:hypothetical protein
MTPRPEGDSIIKVLSVLDDDGSVVVDNLSFDQSNSLQVYHRLFGSFLEPKESGFGHHVSYTRVLDMSLMVMYDRGRIAMAPEDMELLINMKFPFKIPASQLPQGFASCQFHYKGAEYNQMFLFERDFGIKDFTYGPGAVLLEVKYKLECSYNPDCINVLCCD